MRMHTIPQNVTSYEDKIVGMFVGRQFIYLAVGGVTVFILMSTGGGGTILIRLFLSAIIGGFTVALALLKINDRSFDILFLGYLKAILGPTEWTWQKQEPIMAVLAAPDRQVGQQATQLPPSMEAERQRYRERKEQYQSYLSQRQTDLDPSEQSFLAQLNFGEPVPHRTFAALTPKSPPPPMLTPERPIAPKPKPAAPPPAPLPTSPVQPIAHLAQSTTRPVFTISLGGRQQSFAWLQNQRVNRSLSRQLVSGGTLPLPVRGELRLQLTPDFQQELSRLVGFAPQSGDVEVAAVQTNALPSPFQPPAEAMVHVISGPSVSGSTDSGLQTAAGENSTLHVPNTSQPSMEQKIDVAKQWHEQPTPTPPSPLSGQTAAGAAQKTADASARPPAPPKPQEPPYEAAFAEMERRAREQREAERREQASRLAEQQAHHRVLEEHYRFEVERLKERSELAERKAREAEAQLARMQEQLKSATQAPPPVATQVQQQQELVDKLKAEQDLSKQYAAELNAQMARLAERSEQPEPSAPPAAPSPVTSSTPEPIVASAPPPSLDQLPTLTQESNMIHGFVFDQAGQFLQGAVIVVKDAGGEPKRALRTNKLGQFVITTPLPNGSYTVEVDKKGLSFDIMKADLQGNVLEPLIIRAKTA